MRGFALDPGPVLNKGYVQVLEYCNVEQLARGVREPCQQACQGLMMPYFHDLTGRKICFFELKYMDRYDDGQEPSEYANKFKKMGRRQKGL